MASRTPRKTASSKKVAPPAPLKERYHHGDLRQSLIDAALRLVSEEGFAALTLREVARRAGVTHAAPYRHFADKEALLTAVAAEGFRLMATRMRERMARETDLSERFTASGLAYVQFAVEHPAHFRVMFGPHFTRKPDPELLGGEDASAFGVLLDIIRECQQAGVLREGEPRELARTAWCLVHGLASLLVDRQLEPEVVERAGGAEGLARTQARHLLEGFGAGFGRATRG